MNLRSLDPSDKLDYFPHLVFPDNYHVTSDESGMYNCVAWAVGQTNRRWDPTPGYYWPAGVSRDHTDPQCFIGALSAVGFSECADGSLEVGFQKVAIYTRHGEPTHVARQLPNGRWTSKLGYWEDIEHISEHDVSGDCAGCYGHVYRYMRKPHTL